MEDNNNCYFFLKMFSDNYEINYWEVQYLVVKGFCLPVTLEIV